MKQPTVGLLVIGDEILSGQTKEANSHTIATALYNHGCHLTEVRVVADDETAIVMALKDLQKTNDFIMTTGGIGATHDDMTMAAVAKFLQLPLVLDEEADQLLQDHYQKNNLPYNEQRRKMAMVAGGKDAGAKLLYNPISIAPGFFIKNIFVMAGVPLIMQAMLKTAITLIPEGPKWWRVKIDTTLGEGMFAEGLTKIQQQYPEVMIGSYPKFHRQEKILWAQIILKTLDVKKGEACQRAVESLLAELSKDYQPLANPTYEDKQ